MSLKRIMQGDTLLLYKGNDLVLSLEEVQQDEKTIAIKLNGILNSDALHDFQDELTALTYLGLDLLIDFESVTYLSSGCVQVLVDIQQKMDRQGKGHLILRKMPDALMKELDSTGASELLDVE